MVNLVNNPSSTEEKPLPNPMMAILFFFIVTSIYCAISLFIVDSSQRFIAKICYVLFVISGEYFINLNLSESMCGIRQWQTSFFITIIPWVLIFVLLHLFLVMFPGWMTPFSNTFGYLVAKLMGLPDLMKKILVENGKEPEVSRALESVRTDNSLLINELYTEKGETAKDASGVPTGRTIRPIFDNAWNKLVEGQIIKNFPDTNPNDKESKTSLKNKLYGFVQMKFTIAEYIWNILTGSLVTSISYNYIINTGCAKSPQEMKRRYDKYEEEQDEKKNNKEKQGENQPTYVQS